MMALENRLISLNPKYPPLTADGDRVLVLGKVLEKAEEN
jgi:SOS-response transcriptional repressor LexA